MTPNKYQAAMQAAFYADLPRLQYENRRLKRIVLVLFLANTVQWLAQWL